VSGEERRLTYLLASRYVGPMGRPRLQENDVATRDRLLEAAEAEFADRGFEGARLEDIAEQAGIRRPSLLYHFATKDELYAAVVRTVFSSLGDMLLEATSLEGPFSERFDRAVRRLTAFFEDRPSAGPLILRELLDRRGPGHALLLEAGVPILQRMERFVRDEGRASLRSDVPIRQALLQIFSAVIVRASAGPLRDPIWGKIDKTRSLARALVSKDAS
jgi:TetR/AcrR family transcriptional regulator